MANASQEQDRERGVVDFEIQNSRTKIADCAKFGVSFEVDD